MEDIYVIRHGKTQMNEAATIMGHHDSDLSLEHLYRIAELGKKMSGFGITTIFSSDLGRAKRTAGIIHQELGKITLDHSPALREIDYGELSGMHKHLARERFSGYKVDPAFIHPGGESFLDMHARVKALLESLPKEQTILLVTHAGCIRAIYSMLSGKSPKSCMGMQISHDKIMHIDRKAGKVRFL